MNRLLSELRAAISCISATPARVLALVRERDITWEIADSRGAYATAA